MVPVKWTQTQSGGIFGFVWVILLFLPGLAYHWRILILYQSPDSLHVPSCHTSKSDGSGWRPASLTHYSLGRNPVPSSASAPRSLHAKCEFTSLQLDPGSWSHNVTVYSFLLSSICISSLSLNFFAIAIWRMREALVVTNSIMITEHFSRVVIYYRWFPPQNSRLLNEKF